MFTHAVSTRLYTCVNIILNTYVLSQGSTNHSAQPIIELNRSQGSTNNRSHPITGCNQLGLDRLSITNYF
jgi:hypothetical protein